MEDENDSDDYLALAGMYTNIYLVCKQHSFKIR